jgi:hypothetical protein
VFSRNCRFPRKVWWTVAWGYLNSRLTRRRPARPTHSPRQKTSKSIPSLHRLVFAVSFIQHGIGWGNSPRLPLLLQLTSFFRNLCPTLPWVLNMLPTPSASQVVSMSIDMGSEGSTLMVKTKCRYHGIANNPYPLPNDDAEKIRLDSLQYCISRITGGNILVPITRNPTQICTIPLSTTPCIGLDSTNSSGYWNGFRGMGN